MEADFIEGSVRTRLIVAGINELEERGVKDFSLRRVALAAEVSCAAPYRHFKDKDDFENYGILSHSIKSDSKYLGFMDLAEIALSHEMAGKSSDKKFIDENYDSLNACADSFDIIFEDN